MLHAFRWAPNVICMYCRLQSALKRCLLFPKQSVVTLSSVVCVCSARVAPPTWSEQATPLGAADKVGRGCTGPCLMLYTHIVGSWLSLPASIPASTQPNCWTRNHKIVPLSAKSGACRNSLQAVFRPQPAAIYAARAIAALTCASLLCLSHFDQPTPLSAVQFFLIAS